MAAGGGVSAVDELCDDGLRPTAPAGDPQVYTTLSETGDAPCITARSGEAANYQINHAAAAFGGEPY